MGKKLTSKSKSLRSRSNSLSSKSKPIPISKMSAKDIEYRIRELESRLDPPKGPYVGGENTWPPELGPKIEYVLTLAEREFAAREQLVPRLKFTITKLTLLFCKAIPASRVAQAIAELAFRVGVHKTGDLIVAANLVREIEESDEWLAMLGQIADFPVELGQKEIQPEDKPHAGLATHAEASPVPQDAPAEPSPTPPSQPELPVSVMPVPASESPSVYALPASSPQQPMNCDRRKGKFVAGECEKVGGFVKERRVQKTAIMIASNRYRDPRSFQHYQYNIDKCSPKARAD